MGDPQFGFKRNLRILDQKLKLDPEIEKMILEIEAQMLARKLLEQWKEPDFQLLVPDWASLLGSNIMLSPPQGALPPQPPKVAKGPGFKMPMTPITPRAGELSDVAKAIYKLPAVQKIVEDAHDEGMRQLRVLRGEWSKAGVGEKTIMITMTTTVIGGMITTIVANKPTRDLAFSLIKGKDIPVPKIDGLSFKIMDHGYGVTIPLGVPGLSGSTHVNVPSLQRVDYGATINFDLMEFLKKREKK